MVDGEILYDNVECLEKRYINVMNYYYKRGNDSVMQTEVNSLNRKRFLFNWNQLIVDTVNSLYS